MKIIIAGSRGAPQGRSYLGIGYCCGKMMHAHPGFKITEIVCGGAAGVDEWGKQLAQNYGIPVKLMLADWDQYGKKAGYIRNAAMADYADALIAIWDGKSPGTKMMIELARKKGMPVEVYRLDLPTPF